MYKRSDFCLITASDNEMILQECLLRSPDVVDNSLPVEIIRDAPSMTRAYNQGLAATLGKICLFAHQDVYLPAGFLDRAVQTLNDLSLLDPNWLVAGPYGVRPDGFHAGRVWDVTLHQELGQRDFKPVEIGSLDELLLILRRDLKPEFQFDEQLPHFHLYGTDLVQSALADGYSSWAVELPVVHNNRPIATLAGGYTDAYRYTRRKWRHLLPIPTTICALSYNPLSLARARLRRYRVAERPADLLADAVEVAQLARYE